MPKFRLVIELENDAMQTPWSVAHALGRIADKLAKDADSRDKPMEPGGENRIHDLNGNTVGFWRVEP